MTDEISNPEITTEIKARLNGLTKTEQESILQKVSQELNLTDAATLSGAKQGTPTGLKQGANAPPYSTVGSATPDKGVVNYIWTAIITGFLIVFVGSAAGLVVALFMFHGLNPQTHQPMDNTGIIQPLITLFTAAVGFLAGVLTPSPVHSNQGQVNQGHSKQGQ